MPETAARMAALPTAAGGRFFQLKMKPPGSDAPIVLVKWYAYAKWVLERVESFPKSQRFILGQRLSNHVMDVLETLVKASYARDKAELLIRPVEREQQHWLPCCQALEGK